MPIARSKLIDLNVTRWYHCISRCVRREALLGGSSGRKQWVEDRIKELAEIFAVGVGGFSVMDNHMHLLVRLDENAGNGWSDEEVVRRWASLYPPRDKSRNPLSNLDKWVQEKLEDVDWVKKTRARLQNISWFMKCLKEPISRRANREDKCRGAFWESRFTSVAVLDDGALLATSMYIDLNPVAAKVAKVPEASAFTSIKQRVDHIKEAEETAGLEAAKSGSVAGSQAAGGLEEKLWLCPIEDRRRWDSTREGMFADLSIGNYLLLVDFTGRLFREGKARISAELAGILERIGSSAEDWQFRMEKLRDGRRYGRFFATSREILRKTARHLNVRYLVNLMGCAAPI